MRRSIAMSSRGTAHDDILEVGELTTVNPTLLIH